MKYFAKIEYVGTDFSGFQVQPDRRTVQGELCAALAQAFGAPCRVTGCSRTDRGVHAREFCLTIETDGANIPPKKLPVAVARYLPPDLSLYYASACREDFHARHDVVSKEYVYRIYNAPVIAPFEYHRAWIVYPHISDEAIARMQEAAPHFVGKKDFAACMAQGSDVVSTVRTVQSLTVERNGREILVRIRADGFLYNMVRIIVGTLMEVAAGRMRPDEIPNILESKTRSLAGMTAPPDGLYLNRVEYDKNPDPSIN